MTLGVAPAHIERLLDTPGRNWSDAGRRDVVAWLLIPRRIRSLLVYTSRHLGAGTTAEDAEDALYTFVARDLDATFDLYDPARGLRFQTYMLMRLRQVCWKAGRRIRQRREEPLTHRDSDDAPIELEIADGGASTEKQILDRLALEHGLAAMPPGQRAVIVRHYFEDKAVRTIAAELRLTESNVKARLWKGRHWLRQYLAPV
jgi:RNA polymerase sigma factor (sigma-70 family)